MQATITLLLTGAIQASYALDRLQQLANSHTDGDPTAAADLAEAIRLLTGVRADLIQDADNLAAPPPPSNP